MSKVQSKLSSRLLAALLTVVMVLSMLPISAIPAFAATGDHTDWGVSITVKDDNGEPLPGATVTYHIDSVANGADFETGTATTDAAGSVEVLTKDKYVEGDLTLSATVSLTDYVYADGSGALADVAITSDDQDFAIQMKTTKITGVTVSATSVTYDGEDHPAATVSGTKDGDTVTYKLGEEAEQSEMPTIKEPGTYSLVVKVQRDGFDDFVKTVQPAVSKATIELNVVEYSASYDQNEHPALTVTGLLDTDTVTYALNGGDPMEEIPTIKNVGDYSVAIHVERYGHNDFDHTYSNIHIVATTIEGLTATSHQGTYDGEYHDAVTVSGTIDGDKIEYKLGDDGSWSEDVPQIKDAGNYTVFVRVTRTNYEVTSVDVVPANAYIAKATQTIEFTQTVPTTITVDTSDASNNVYDFSASAENIIELSGNAIQYTLIDASADNVAIIDENTGALTVQNAGIVTVKAVRPGNNNYEDAVTYATVTITMPSDGLVSFGVSTKDYYLDEVGVVSEEVATKLHDDDNGALTYSIDKTNVGLKIDATTGVVSISNRRTLFKEMGKNGSVVVVITVNKAPGTVTETEWYFNNIFDWGTREITREVYTAATATYTLTISYEAVPEFDTVCNITDPADTGWYNADHPAIITPIDDSKYLIALDEPENFTSSITITEQGTDTHSIFLKNITTRRISAAIELNIKVDTVAPSTDNMKITYSESVLDKVLSAVTFGYYNPSVTVTFEASDETSGLSHLNWTYTREPGASTANLETEAGEIEFDSDGKAELVLSGEDAKQYRGNLSFTATDIAGNTSDVKNDTDHVLIVDTIAPNCEVSYADPLHTVTSGEKQQRYFNGDVTLTITVTENNFYDEEFVLKVSKDGAEAEAVSPSWENALDESGEVVDNVFVGTYTLTGDGDYVVFAEYKDRSYNPEASSNNIVFEYESDVITIDTINPVVSFSFDQSKQETTISVVEHNFRAVDITATVDAKDRNGNAVNANDLTAELRSASWTQSGDTYTYTTKNYVNGIYNIRLDYKDLADRAGTFTGEEFIIDHDKPTAPVIEYSTSITDTVSGALTLGFYNPDVTITFTSYDSYSGVDYFTWSYTRQEDVSESNVASYAETQLKATADDADKAKFTASITLPLNEAEQLRGYIAATATDTYNNQSDKYTDSGKIIVVDSVSPTMTVEYSEESNKVGSTLYYGSDKNGQVEVTLNVTEANFFSEDVVVKVAKNGAEATRVSPTWTDVDADKHIGKFTISGDGHYVVTVEYTDRSTNEMSKYTSDTITLDTVKPVIVVDYQNNNIINTLTDRDGNQREYFDKVQTAVVTITEHNFNADDVQFSIVGKDVTGAERNIDSLITRSAWSTNGDVHRITITYSGDANYTFDVDYTDLVTNKADDYSPDYFTVDTVAPTVTSVTYSTSVLETVLQSVSFGFYNAKMTVTITATDDTAGVHKFDYSCLTAAGVSSVNAQLLDQAIEEANITYSNGGRTATMSFEIPKMVLGNDNQFNGTVKVDAIDRSNNKVEQSETKRIVVDNIAPTATVTYNDPVNSVDGISYYDGNINGAITVNEANFYSDDVVVMVSKDGGAAQVLPTAWSDSSVDVHVGSFTLSEDGDYVITITYRDKSGNTMADYTSNQLTLDTAIEEPTYIINGTPQSGDNGGAYKDETEVSFSFEDQNYDTNTIKLTRTRFDKVEDVTEEFIKALLNEKGGSGSFTIPEKVEYDGIYLLTITMTDKANHSTESHVRFTVNRFGSVYAYDDYLCSLIKDGGQYVKLDGDAAITKDLVITEYNADRIVDGSLKILITRDSEPIDVIYTNEPVDSTGWFEYVYTISKDNFKEDGVYKITISSEDATGNASTSVPENSIDKDGAKILDVMKFTVDTVAPEIRNIVNLENAIADRDAIIDGELNVKYTLIDVGGLAKVEVYLNGELIDTIEEFENNNSYSGAFDINESNDVQTVRLVVTDLAGNVTDTASDEFDPGDLYVFNDTVTVSTNFFVRWYRNTPLFWGSVGGVGVLAAGSSFFLAKNKKKKEEEVK